MPEARRPPTAAAPSPARTTSSTVAETAEPVTTSRTPQHAGTPPMTAQRFRLGCRSGVRTGRRAASLPSVIEYRPRSVLDSSDCLIRADPPVPVTEDAGSAPVSQRITGSFQMSGSCQGEPAGVKAGNRDCRLTGFWADDTTEVQMHIGSVL